MNRFFNFEDGRGLVPFTLHPNGGGKVAATATVEPLVHLGAGCMVYGFAKVRGNASITGRARIDGDENPHGVSTLIEDGVRIAGNVKISGCVLLRDSADIRDDVELEGCVEVLHHARIAGKAKLKGWVRVMDSSYLSGSVELTGNVEPLTIRGETYLSEGLFFKDSELAVAVRKDLARQEGHTRKKAVRAC